MRKLQLKHLEAFRAVVIRGSASAAARQLGISQPAISKIIAQTEQLMGFNLFDRRQGRLAATARALLLYEQVAPLFTTMERVDDIVDRIAAGQSAPVTIGAVPLLAVTLLPKVIKKELIDRQFAIAVTSQDGVLLTNRVAAGQLEFALVAAMHGLEGVESAVVARSPMFCAVPVAHPLATRRVIHGTDLAAEPYISLANDEGIQARIDLLLEAHGVHLSKVISCPLMAGAIAMAENGIGLTLADAFALQLARKEKLRCIPFEPEFHLEYRAIWPQGRISRFNRRALLNECQRQSSRIIEAAMSIKGLDAGGLE